MPDKRSYWQVKLVNVGYPLIVLIIAAAIVHLVAKRIATSIQKLNDFANRITDGALCKE